MEAMPIKYTDSKSGQKDYICEGHKTHEAMKVGDKAKASPQLTGETEWVEGKVIDIEQNPFRGTVISIEDGLGRIYWGEAQYFQPVQM